MIDQPKDENNNCAINQIDNQGSLSTLSNYYNDVINGSSGNRITVGSTSDEDAIITSNMDSSTQDSTMPSLEYVPSSYFVSIF